MFASEKTIRHLLLVLPYSSQAGLYLLAVRHFSYLLKLIYADNNAFSLLYGNLFSHSQHLFRRMRLGRYA